MLCGWVGSELEINLSSGKIERSESSPQFLATYLGGKGTNAKILWDRVPPEVDPLSPDSVLILSPGALVGTVLPAFNRFILTYRSPLTGLHGHSAVGGCFGPELKYAGYDTVIISGKSTTPVYIWINDDKVEIRDASRLWGKDVWETQKLIYEELKD
jgi:aldehyde:ferredoxin oxidoreductase